MTPENIIARREAEAALLASILVWPYIIAEVKAKITPEDFHDAPFHKGFHARIFRAMCLCDSPDQCSVAAKLNETGQLLGGDCAYLAGLVAGTFGQATQTIYWDANDYPRYIEAVISYTGRKGTPKIKGGWTL